MTDTQLEVWVEALAAELGIDTAVVDVARLLDVARVAADTVSRPTAPLTTFLIGYAVGQAAMSADRGIRGAAADAFDQAIETATALSHTWAEEAAR